MKQKSKLLKWYRVSLGVIALWLLCLQVSWAMPPQMHIMEGFLSPFWCIFWYVLCLPFWLAGGLHLKKVIAEKPETRLLLGMSGAFCFVLSALKLPSVTGSSSHPTGTGLGAILFGPRVMAVLGTLVLIFQALLLAHGGITTLGANAFSMAIVGPLVAWSIWKLLNGRIPSSLVVFLAALLANWLTYVVTSAQLALAYPDPSGGVVASFLKFAGIFAITQIPLAISEGLLTVLIVNALRTNAQSELSSLCLKGF